MSASAPRPPTPGGVRRTGDSLTERHPTRWVHCDRLSLDEVLGRLGAICTLAGTVGLGVSAEDRLSLIVRHAVRAKLELESLLAEAA